MSQRSFRDEKGIVWSVAAVTRTGSEAGAVRPSLRSGWLLFQSPTEKRRFGPVPEHWEALQDAELASLCAKALISKPMDALLNDLRQRGGAADDRD